MATVKSRKEILTENQRLKEEIEKRHGKTVEELCAEREKRVRDAIELREPDRVPVTVGTGIFAARYAGLTASAMYYDHTAFREATKKMLLEFEPDIGQAGGGRGDSGLVFELLDMKDHRWPGGDLPLDVSWQFVEGEYMKADEYDLFLDDPSDFFLRYHLPRVYGIFAPLSKLPPLKTLPGREFRTILHLFASPEFRRLGENLYKAALEVERLAKEGAEFAKEMASLGYPSQGGGGGRTMGQAPFDTISDLLRGMRETMLDMYRRPDKLLAALDKILEWRRAQAAPVTPDPKGNPRRAGMTLHRGSDGFMSLKQFETFYWPTLKEAGLTNIELGFIFSPFCEGVWDDRLEYWLEFPKGKLLLNLERTDIFRAKEILGNHCCLQGGVPSTILQTGSPQDIEEYCKKLIKVVGKGGGFILAAGSSIDCAKPANIKAMVDSVKKYGRY